MPQTSSQSISAQQRNELLATLKARFQKNKARHKGIEWDAVQARLETRAAQVLSLQQMESTGGEPDVVGYDKATGAYLFYDCAAETPRGRRSLCYDREGLESRKEFKPENNAMDMAAAMGVHMLTEEEYRYLQTLGVFDSKTSSWIQTPEAIRQLGGALFCDYRYGKVFTYHNGAQSYYASRGFRASLKV